MPSGSWKTAVAGWAAIIADLAGLIAKTIEQHGIPTEPSTWIIFGSVLAAGIGNILSKDHDKTNSKDPAKAVTVTPAVAATANPAEVNP
jgi:hypothetical protein